MEVFVLDCLKEQRMTALKEEKVMMRSLYSGVSGLRIHQTKLDVIGNNIANVNTVGFKSSSVTFTDILYQTTQSASGPNATTGTVGKNAMQIGLGATVGSISTNMSTGSSQRTDNALDLMINGDAFFIVNDGSQNYFTKAGSFTVDANGTLCTSTGLAVMGWLPTEDGSDIEVDTVKQLDVMSAENLYTPPEATSKAHLTGNIDPKDSQLSTGRSVTIPIYDNVGNEYTVVLNLKQNTTPSGSNDEYFAEISDIKDSDGKSILKDTTPGSTSTTGFEARFGSETKAVIAFDGTNGTFENVTAGGTAGTNTNSILTLNITGATPNPFSDTGISIDFSELTAFATKGTSTVEGQRGDTEGVGAGKAVGNMKGISIDESGKIYGSYDNGDKKLLGQVSLATFPNAAGLESVGNSLYSATLNSGEFNGIGKDITSIGGSLTSGVLEMSNVDLASEFTELIVAQRGYQANSRIITTSDTLLEELINLKR